MFGATFSAQNASRPGVDVLGTHGLNQTVPAGATMFTAPYAAGLQNIGMFTAWPVKGVLSDLTVMITSAQPASGSLRITLGVTAGNIIAIVPAGAAAFSVWKSFGVFQPLVAGGNIIISVLNNAAVASAQVGGITVRLDMS